MRSIYNRFGLVLSAYAEERMYAFLKAGRGKKGKKHVYRLSDFGLDPNRENPIFAAYRERFGIEREPL